MPIFDMECQECNTVFEFLKVKSDDFPICPKCGCYGPTCKKIFSMMPNIRMNSDDILHNLPDPSPPLEELRGKGTEGYKDKPEASSNLGKYKRRKDKYGNTIWEEKKKIIFDMGGK